MNHPCFIIREKLADRFFSHLPKRYAVLCVEAALEADLKRRQEPEPWNDRMIKEFKDLYHKLTKE